MEQKFGINSIDIDVLRDFCEAKVQKRGKRQISSIISYFSAVSFVVSQILLYICTVFK